jgi:hypothetical protein
MVNLDQKSPNSSFMAKVKKITPDLQEVVDKQLSSKEIIEWMDQPISTVSSSDFKFIYFFEIVWTIIFFAILGLKSIIGIVVYLSIFLVILIPFFIHFKLLKTVYLITTKRAVIIEPSWQDISFTALFRKDIRKIFFQVLNPFNTNFCNFDKLIVKLPVYSSVIKSYTPGEINNFSVVKAPNKIGSIKLSSKKVTSIIGQKRTIYFGFFNIKNPQQPKNIIIQKIEEYRINRQR